MAVGVVLAFVFGYFTLILNTNPVLAGIALNTLSGGLTVFTTYYLTGNKGSTQSLKSPVMPEIRIPAYQRTSRFSVPLSPDIMSPDLSRADPRGRSHSLLLEDYHRLRIRAVGERMRVPQNP